LFFYSHQFIKTAIDVSKTDFIQWRSHSIDIEKVCLSIVLQIYLYALNKRLLVFARMAVIQRILYLPHTCGPVRRTGHMQGASMQARFDAVELHKGALHT